MAAHAARCDQVPGQDAQLAGPGGWAGMHVWGGRGRRQAGSQVATKCRPTLTRHWRGDFPKTVRAWGREKEERQMAATNPPPLPPQVRQAKRDLAWTRQREQWIAGAAAGVHLALFSFNLAFWGFEGTPPDRYNPSNIRCGEG